jgi:hypothetical protein
MTEWHSGPPPSLGWWPCRLEKWPAVDLRWWNGRHWSCSAHTTDTSEQAAQIARLPTTATNRQIQWSFRPDSWPERSRT